MFPNAFKENRILNNDEFVPMFAVDKTRYDELIAKENELKLLKQALLSVDNPFASGIETIKATFNIKEQK